MVHFDSTRHFSYPWQADERNRHYIIEECFVEAAVVLDVPSYATSTMYPDLVLAKASGYAGGSQQYSADMQSYIRRFNDEVAATCRDHPLHH